MELSNPSERGLLGPWLLAALRTWTSTCLNPAAMAEGATRREGGNTRRETAGVPGTRREGMSGGGGTRREGMTTVFVRVALPPDLADRVVVVEELSASGSEADVVIVEGVDDAVQHVLKLYRRGVTPDEEAVARLARANRAHVVEIVESGWAGGCFYDVLEFCKEGTLRSLLAEDRRPAMNDDAYMPRTSLWAASWSVGSSCSWLCSVAF